MGESTKAVSAFVMIIASIATAVAWIADRPDATTWAFRIGSPLLALASLGFILKLHARADLAHDYLRERTGSYFNRDGFCFALIPDVIDRTAYICAYFQNQYDQPSIGRIALRPARGFFMGRANIDAITYEVECAPAAFGFARIAVPIPQKLQGKRQSFEVGASVEYPNGKGRRLRFHDGIFLRTNTNFGNGFRTAVTIAGAAGGAIVLSKPATATMDLPLGVGEELSAPHPPEIVTLWQLGDPASAKVA
jgi:hypothetical protein